MNLSGDSISASDVPDSSHEVLVHRRHGGRALVLRDVCIVPPFHHPYLEYFKRRCETLSSGENATEHARLPDLSYHHFSGTDFGASGDAVRFVSMRPLGDVGRVRGISLWWDNHFCQFAHAAEVFAKLGDDLEMALGGRHSSSRARFEPL